MHKQNNAQILVEYTRELTCARRGGLMAAPQRDGVVGVHPHRLRKT
jgi:hypothetical protein